jgi:hypothetical protein
MDRFINWSETPPAWGRPTIHKVAAVLKEFLGPRWKVEVTDPTWIVAECDDPQTFPLRPEYEANSQHVTETFLPGWDEMHSGFTRGFEFSFPDDPKRPTSVITRSADEFTRALADQFTKIIARWWHGEVDWPS